MPYVINEKAPIARIRGTFRGIMTGPHQIVCDVKAPIEVELRRIATGRYQARDPRTGILYGDVKPGAAAVVMDAVRGLYREQIGEWQAFDPNGEELPPAWLERAGG